MRVVGVRSPVPLAALAVAVGVAACGGSGSSSSGTGTTGATTTPATTAPGGTGTTTAPGTGGPGTGTTPMAHAPEPTTPLPSTGPNTNPPPPADTGTSGTTPHAGHGDEVPVRVPATFVVRDGRLAPARVVVPPFLAVQVTVRSDQAPHTIVLRTPMPKTLKVASGGRAGVRVAGLHAGRYAVELDGRPAGTIVAANDAGGP